MAIDEGPKSTIAMSHQPSAMSIDVALLRRALRGFGEQPLDDSAELLLQPHVLLAGRGTREPRMDAADAAVAAEEDGRRIGAEVDQLRQRLVDRLRRRRRRH